MPLELPPGIGGRAPFMGSGELMPTGRGYGYGMLQHEPMFAAPPVPTPAPAAAASPDKSASAPAPALRLHHLVLASAALRSLDLSPCGRLAAAPALKTPALEELTVPVALAPRLLSPLLRTCAGLRRLRLDGNAALTELDIELGELRELSLLHCGRLSRARIAAPQLEALHLRGCGRLRELSLATPRLLTLDLADLPLTSDAVLQALSGAPAVRAYPSACCRCLGLCPGLTAGA
jgi:hypothetical protein